MSVHRGALRILWILLLAEFVVTRTVTHRETVYDTNGDKVVKAWTANDDADDDYDYMHNNPFSQRLGSGDDVLKYLPRSLHYPQRTYFRTYNDGESTVPNDELLKQAALHRGMNPSAIDELLRTKQPVVTTTYDGHGNKHTTTYTLQPDGSVSRRTLMETKPITRTYTKSWDVDPTLKHPIEPVAYLPKASEKHPVDDDDDVSERRSKPTAEATTVRLPESWNPNHWPRNIQPIFSRSGFDTSPFDLAGIDTNTPGTITKTRIDENGNKITTTYRVGPPQVSPLYPTQKHDEVPAERPPTTTSTTTMASTTTTHVPTTTTRTPTSTVYRGIPTPTPLPPLEEFLKRQYGSTPNTATKVSSTTPKLSTGKSTTPALATTTTQKHITTTTTTKKPVSTIKLEDLPAVQVPLNGKPLDDSLIKTLPKIEDIPRLDIPGVRTLDQTVETPTLPTLSDLSPSVQDMLKRAGIDPSDIKSIDGDTITKTRREPDGRIITTTYKVRKVPTLTSRNNFDDDDDDEVYRASPPSNPHRSHSQAGSIFPTYTSAHQPSLSNTPTVLTRPSIGYPTHSYNPLAAVPTFTQNPIDDFLAKLGLSVSDIFAKTNEYSKTIVDDTGRVLRVNFVFSLPKRVQRDRENLGDDYDNTFMRNPIK